jgi:hypothetical protein
MFITTQYYLTFVGEYSEINCGMRPFVFGASDLDIVARAASAPGAPPGANL